MSTYSTYTDGELLKFLQNNDQLAFTEIYERYHKDVYLYIAGFVKDPMLAEDLVHEVFIKIWEIRDKLTIQASFSAYLFRVCHNRSINALQKIATDNRLRQRAIAHLQTLQQTTVTDPGELKKYDQLLEDALNSLPPERKKVFILCRQQGMTYEQAAATLGISRNTVKEQISKATRALRNFLADKGEISFALILLEKLF